MYTVCIREVMSQKLKVQVYIHLCTYAQKSGANLFEIYQSLKVLCTCTLYALEKLCHKNWTFKSICMYALMHKNLRANLFEIYQSFDYWKVCSHVHCKYLQPNYSSTTTKRTYSGFCYGNLRYTRILCTPTS